MNLIEFYFEYVLRGAVIVLISSLFILLPLTILWSSNIFEFIFFALITLVILPGIAVFLYYITFRWNTL